MFKEFKEFALKGNMLDMAIGIVIGAAFGTVVSSLVNDILMPIISGIFRIPDFSNLFIMLSNPEGGSYSSVDVAREAGASVLAYGLFINAFFAFLIVAFALFMIIKGINQLKREQEQAEEAPSAPPREEVLLEEIRDLLAKA